MAATVAERIGQAFEAGLHAVASCLRAHHARAGHISGLFRLAVHRSDCGLQLTRHEFHIPLRIPRERID